GARGRVEVHAGEVQANDQMEVPTAAEGLHDRPESMDDLLGSARRGEALEHLFVLGRNHESLAGRVATRRPPRVDADLVRDPISNDLPRVPVLPGERVLELSETEGTGVSPGGAGGVLGGPPILRHPLYPA